MEKKMRIVTLLTIASISLIGWVARSAEPEPSAHVKRIVTAAGGEEKLLKLFRIKERLNVSSDPDKKGDERVSILEPPTHWWIGTSERGQEPAKFLAWAWTLGAITNPASKVESIPEIIELDKPAFGLRVSGSINPPMDLYFDENSSRLVRIDWRTDIHRLSDWKDRDGMQYPAICIGYKKSTGVPWYFSEILELEPLDALPEGLKR
jgi:hypothetical protein